MENMTNFYSFIFFFDDMPWDKEYQNIENIIRMCEMDISVYICVCIFSSIIIFHTQKNTRIKDMEYTF